MRAPRIAGTAVASAAVLLLVGRAATAELPALPAPQEVKQRPVVEMLPPGVRRPSRGFSLVDPATAPRRDPPPPAGGIDFGEVGSGPRGLQLELPSSSRRR